MKNKKIIIYSLILICFTAISLKFADAFVISRLKDINEYNFHGLNLFPFFSLIDTFKSNFMNGINMLFRNIIVGIILGFIISLFFARNIDNTGKNIRNSLFLLASYYTELMNLFFSLPYIVLGINLNRGNFDIDSVILRFAGCFIGSIISYKIKIKLKKQDNGNI
jgi:ABC-type phosphate/phosphonate transport system permease subunit